MRTWVSGVRIDAGNIDDVVLLQAGIGKMKPDDRDNLFSIQADEDDQLHMLWNQDPPFSCRLGSRFADFYIATSRKRGFTKEQTLKLYSEFPLDNSVEFVRFAVYPDGVEAPYKTWELMLPAPMVLLAHPDQGRPAILKMLKKLTREIEHGPVDVWRTRRFASWRLARRRQRQEHLQKLVGSKIKKEERA